MADVTVQTFIDDFMTSANESAARTALGLEIGTDVQAWSATLDQVTTNGVQDGGGASPDPGEIAVWDTDNVAGTDIGLFFPSAGAATGEGTWLVGWTGLGSNVVVRLPPGGDLLASSDIGSTVQPYNVNTTLLGNSINLASAVTGTLPIANGGTGQTSAADAINALLPSQTGNSGKYLTTNGSAGSWSALPVEIGLACSDEASNLTADTSVVVFRMPYAMTLTAVRASVTTAPTGSNIIVDINENGSSVLSTKLSIDAGENTSTTAATPPVISDSTLADDAEITIDIDQIGSTIAGTGLKVWLIGTRA